MKGFTLLEIVIVIIIIGILAALALPNFGRAKEHALAKEAIANLKLIAAAERIYRMETGNDYPPSSQEVTDINEINSNLKLSLTETNWDYIIRRPGLSMPGFTAIADRQSGPYSACTYQLCSIDPDGEPDKSPSCP